MRKSYREENGEKVFRYSIRKYHFGAASVAVAALMFFANGAVKADPLAVSPATANTEKVNAGVTNLTEGVPLEKSLEAEGNKEIVAPESAEETSNKKDGAGSSAQGEKEIKVSDKAVIPANQTEEINKAETNGKEKEVVTNKDKLESLLKEIDQLNLKDYTEATVKVLQEKVAKAKEVLVNATTQKEIDLAYNALVGYKNAGLKRVPKPKGELTPKPDTTNGKATVGIKAENTEPNGTNIAGHNHSLNGTTRAEGSGFRTAPAGDVTFYHLDGSMETEAGRAPDARYILKFRKGRGYRPQYTSATTTGAYLDYTGQRNEGEFILRTFQTRGSDAAVGTYDFRLRFTDSSTREVYVDQSLKVTVKPNKPTVTVENLENAAGKRAVVNSTARNSNDSVVEFYLNNIKKATIPAVNGKASWTPDEALQTGDQITTKNIARDREFIPATYGGDIHVERSTSDMSNAVTIPTPPMPVLDKDGAIEAIK
ncbi:YSIRK-type signal peptide-containing protein, partial [Streptococcus mitis]|uniref:YSIRK-type signal peptide-containing protein n=1 Tax=Streptococcus mitis TaxID=28037 RepID=UPI000AB73421